MLRVEHPEWLRRGKHSTPQVGIRHFFEPHLAGVQAIQAAVMTFCCGLRLQHANALADRRNAGLLVGPFRLKRERLPFTNSLKASSARSDVNCRSRPDRNRNLGLNCPQDAMGTQNVVVKIGVFGCDDSQH